MRNLSYLLVMFVMYIMLLSVVAMPGNASTPPAVFAAGSEANYSLNGEYSPRSRCKDEAKQQWKRCRKRDRRPNAVCDMELERRRRGCDRLRG
ncbi:MAG: hypothetical protein ACRD43_14560 [Pyrinomonadaceae bacterium]